MSRILKLRPHTHASASAFQIQRQATSSVMSSPSGPRRRPPSQKVGVLVREQLVAAVGSANRAIVTVFGIVCSEGKARIEAPFGCSVGQVIDLLQPDKMSLIVLPGRREGAGPAESTRVGQVPTAMGWFGVGTSMALRRFWASNVGGIRKALESVGIRSFVLARTLEDAQPILGGAAAAAACRHSPGKQDGSSPQFVGATSTSGGDIKLGGSKGAGDASTGGDKAISDEVGAAPDRPDLPAAAQALGAPPPQSSDPTADAPDYAAAETSVSASTGKAVPGSAPGSETGTEAPAAPKQSASGTAPAHVRAKSTKQHKQRGSFSMAPVAGGARGWSQSRGAAGESGASHLSTKVELSPALRAACYVLHTGGGLGHGTARPGTKAQKSSPASKSVAAGSLPSAPERRLTWVLASYDRGSEGSQKAGQDSHATEMRQPKGVEGAAWGHRRRATASGRRGALEAGADSVGKSARSAGHFGGGSLDDISHARSLSMQSGAGGPRSSAAGPGSRGKNTSSAKGNDVPERLVLSAFGFDDPPTNVLERLQVGSIGLDASRAPLSRESRLDFTADDSASRMGRSDSVCTADQDGDRPGEATPTPMPASPSWNPAVLGMTSSSPIMRAGRTAPAIGGIPGISDVAGGGSEPLLPAYLLEGLPRSLMRELGPAYAQAESSGLEEGEGELPMGVLALAPPEESRGGAHPTNLQLETRVDRPQYLYMRFARRLEVGPDLQSVQDLAARLPSSERRSSSIAHARSKALADRPVLLLVSWLPSPSIATRTAEWAADRAVPGEFEGKLALAQHRMAVASAMPHRAKLLAKVPRDLDPRVVWRKLKSVAGYGITRVTVDVVHVVRKGSGDDDERGGPHAESLQSLAFRVPFGKTLGDLRRAVAIALESQQRAAGGGEASSAVSSGSSASKAVLRVSMYRLRTVRRLPSKPQAVVTLQTGGGMRVDAATGKGKVRKYTTDGSFSASSFSGSSSFDAELQARQARQAVALQHSDRVDASIPNPSALSSRPPTALPPRLASKRVASSGAESSRGSTGRSASSIASGYSASRSLVGSLIDKLSDDTVTVEELVSDGETLFAYVGRDGLGASGTPRRFSSLQSSDAGGQSLLYKPAKTSAESTGREIGLKIGLDGREDRGSAGKELAGKTARESGEEKEDGSQLSKEKSAGTGGASTARSLDDEAEGDYDADQPQYNLYSVAASILRLRRSMLRKTIQQHSSSKRKHGAGPSRLHTGVSTRGASQAVASLDVSRSKGTVQKASSGSAGATRPGQDAAPPYDAASGTPPRPVQPISRQPQPPQSPQHSVKPNDSAAPVATPALRPARPIQNAARLSRPGRPSGRPGRPRPTATHGAPGRPGRPQASLRAIQVTQDQRGGRPSPRGSLLQQLAKLKRTSGSPRKARDEARRRREEQQRLEREKIERARQARELAVLRASFPRVDFHAMDLEDRPVGEGKYAVVRLGTWYPRRQREDIGEGSGDAMHLGKSPSAEGAAGGGGAEPGDILLDEEGDVGGVPVAVKQFKNLRDLGRTTEFIHELQGLLSLSDHPNLVRLIGACWEPQMMVVYECLNFGDLRGVIEQAPPNWAAAEDEDREATEAEQSSSLAFWERACLGMDCARGLAYLHDNQRLHRDIKSFNILCDMHPSEQRICGKLGDYGTVKILAMEDADGAPAGSSGGGGGSTGLSLFAARQAELTMERGTMGWVSPEVLGGVEGHESYGPPADVFSLGMVLWELIADDVHENPLLGRAPVDYCNRLERGERPAVNERVPAAYRELLHRCWAFLPEDRPEAGEVADILQQIAKDAGAPPESLK